MQSILKNYQIILESINEGVFTVNHEWRIMSFNRAAEKITGVSRKDAVGRPCSEIFKTDVCQSGCYLRETMDTGKPGANGMVHIVPRAKPIPISVNTAVLRDSLGKSIGGVVIFRDLTELRQLKKMYLKDHTFEDIVSKNEKMLNYFSILPQIAESDSTVLIGGATGTGKEILARAIHNHSAKKDGPFVALNCGALPDTLIESELFGYMAGAFTDARKDKPGKFALAQNGTIFLDEIGDVSKAVQVRLLRVLQEKTYEPLGAVKPEKTNARVIAATNRDLEKLVNEKKFRNDLYFRINVINISLPDLAERKEDIPLLVDHFIERFNCASGKNIAALSPDAMTSLMQYDWPGNVRELENAVEHAFVMCKSDLISPWDLPERFQPDEKSNGYLKSSAMTLKDIEKLALIQALKRNNWKKMVTAKELGIDKNTLRRKIMRFDIRDDGKQPTSHPGKAFGDEMRKTQY